MFDSRVLPVFAVIQNKIMSSIVYFFLITSFILFGTIGYSVSGCVSNGLCSDITYLTVSGTNVKLDLFHPTKGATTLPVVVYIHGGAWVAGDKSAWNDSGIVKKLKDSKKFVVISVNYRLAGRGVDPSIIEYPMQVGAPFPAQIYDLKAAVRWIRANATEYGINSKKIGVLGVSAGGQLASLLGTSGGITSLEGTLGNNNRSSLVQAAAVVAAPEYFYSTNPAEKVLSDSVIWFMYDYLGGDPKTSASAQTTAINAAPVTYITADDPKFFIIHGDKDDIVSMNHPAALFYGFYLIGRNEKYKITSEGGHSEPSDSTTLNDLVTFFSTMPDYTGLDPLGPPECMEQDWSFTDTLCRDNNRMTRSWTKTGTCTGGVTHPASAEVNCVYGDCYMDPQKFGGYVGANGSLGVWNYSGTFMQNWKFFFCYNSVLYDCRSAFVNYDNSNPNYNDTSYAGDGQIVGGKICQRSTETWATYTAPLCTANNWTYTDSACQSNNTLTRTWTKNGDCLGGVTHLNTESVACVYSAPTCTTFSYSAWGVCNSNNTQTRTIVSSSPVGCQGGNPTLTQSCVYVPTCTDSHWTYTDSDCNSNGKLTRVWVKSGTCLNGVTKPASEVINCTYKAPICNYTYSEWSACSQNGEQTRTAKATNQPCNGSPQEITKSCTPPCVASNYDYNIIPNICPASGIQKKEYYQIGTCTGGITIPLDENISCTPNLEDCSYTYSEWGECLPSGVKTRTVLSKSPSICQETTTLTTTNCDYNSQDLSWIDSAREIDWGEENTDETGSTTSNLPTTTPNSQDNTNQNTDTNQNIETPSCQYYCAEKCYSVKGVCCKEIWNPGIESCELNFNETIQKVNALQDEEAINLMIEAVQSAETGNMLKATVLQKLAELKTAQQESTSEKYFAAKTAADEGNYEEALNILNSRRGGGATNSSKTNLFPTIALLFVIAAILAISILIISKKNRSPQNPKD